MNITYVFQRHAMAISSRPTEQQLLTLHQLMHIITMLCLD